MGALGGQRGVALPGVCWFVTGPRQVRPLQSVVVQATVPVRFPLLGSASTRLVAARAQGTHHRPSALLHLLLPSGKLPGDT